MLLVRPGSTEQRGSDPKGRRVQWTPACHESAIVVMIQSFFVDSLLVDESVDFHTILAIVGAVVVAVLSVVVVVVW